MTDRLTQLADRFGADAEMHKDRPLIVEARKEYYARTKPGDRSYGRFGEDIITVGEIVSQVYVRWAADPKVTVEWFDSEVKEPAAMMRTYCINAANDVLDRNIEYRRIEGVGVSAYDDVNSEAASKAAFNGSPMEEDDQWLQNTLLFSTPSAEEDFMHLEEHDRAAQAMRNVVEAIIEGVESETLRTALRAYVFEGMQHKEIEEVYGIHRKTSASAYRRGVKDEHDIACLVTYRNMMHKGVEGTGRAPETPSVVPQALLDAVRESAAG